MTIDPRVNCQSSFSASSTWSPLVRHNHFLSFFAFALHTRQFLESSDLPWMHFQETSDEHFLELAKNDTKLHDFRSSPSPWPVEDGLLRSLARPGTTTPTRWMPLTPKTTRSGTKDKSVVAMRSRNLELPEKRRKLSLKHLRFTLVNRGENYNDVYFMFPCE